jgi:cell division initiation protein
MRYTPVELRHLKIGRGPFGGYSRRETNQLLEDIAESFEDVWRERGELTDKLEDIERRFEELKARETLVASTLVTAERAAADARHDARREAEVIISEAHQDARSVTRTALAERERLFAEVRRIETLLRAALGLVEETGSAPPSEVVGLEPAPVSMVVRCPRREDTREFEAVELPDPGTDDPAPILPTLPPIAEEPVDESGENEDEGEGPWAGRDFAWG